jgi:hypothetical protein
MATGSAESQESKSVLGGSSTLELRQFRDAWLFGDDQSIAVRLESLDNDNRLQGVLPRWISLMRAGHAMRLDKPGVAEEAIAKVLENAKGPRPYIQAIRIYLLHGDIPRALNVASLASAVAPNVDSLAALKADLTFLNGDPTSALGLYTEILSKLTEPAAPYALSNPRVWSSAHNFEGNGGTTPPPDVPLFVSPYWYQTRFPGLEHCLLAMSKDKDLAATMRAMIPGGRENYDEAQDTLYSYRGGDAEHRAKLVLAVSKAKWELLLAVRVAALAALESDQPRKALGFIKNGEELGVEDIAYQDLTARVYGALGMAEEARSGPLARLRQRTDLRLGDASILFYPTGRGRADRVFTAALNLYRANPEGGEKQFEELRRSFGYNAESPVPHSVIGVWLAGKGEFDLARKYLREGSKLQGYLGGKALYQDVAASEFVLWALGPAAQEQPEETPPEDEAEGDTPEDEDTEGEDETPVEDFTQVLAQTGRAGAILSSLADTENLLEFLTNVSIWGRNGSIHALTRPLDYIPEGHAAIERLLFNYPTELADNLGKSKLETLLSDKHQSSVALKQSIEALSKSIDQVRSNDDWRSREALGEAAPPFFGKIESRVLLLRAHLKASTVTSLEELTAWTETWQASIDLRTHWNVNSSERLINARKAREEAGMPEIFHSGLLIDAAEKLAAAGKIESAALLLWHNRDCYLGVDSIQRLMTVAASYAKKAGLQTIAVRCKLVAFNGERPRFAEEDNMKLIIELPQTIAHVKKYGDLKEINAYIEAHLIPRADTSDMQAIYRIAPEFAKAPAAAVATRPAKDGLKSLWLAALQQESNWVYLHNWAKLSATPTAVGACDRLLDYIVASDFPAHERRRFSGLVSTPGFLHVLAMKAFLEGEDCFACTLLQRLGGIETTRDAFTHYYFRD